MSFMIEGSKPKSQTFFYSVVLPEQANSVGILEASADFQRWSISVLPLSKGYDVTNSNTYETDY